MDDRYLPILEDALRNYRKKEGFEGALSRAVKKSGKKYDTYIEIITELRDYAYHHDIAVVVAAKRVREMLVTAEESEERPKISADEPYTKV